MEHVRPDKQVVDPHQRALTTQCVVEAHRPDVSRAHGDANIPRQARLLRDEWRRTRYSRLKPT